MKEQQFTGLMRGPSIIRQIREGVKHSPNATPISAIVEEVIHENDYPLSTKQQRIADISLPIADENRSAVRRAEWLHRHQPQVLSKRIARLFGSMPEEIGDLTFHEASITAVVPHDDIDKVCVVLNQQYEVDAYKAKNIAGLAGEQYDIKAQKKTLPVSAKNKLYDNKFHSHVAEHENLHTQYRYLHPQKSEDQVAITPAEYLNQLRQETTNAIVDQDINAFREVVKKVNHDQISLYLNELSSEALTNHHSPLSEAFGGRTSDHPYSKIYYKQIDILKEIVESNSDEVLPWIQIILEENEKAYHKADFIHNAYTELKESGTPTDDLIAIAEFITPEQGYIIRAFVDRHPTFSKMKNWKKEYETEENSECPEVTLILESLHIDPNMYYELGIDFTPYDDCEDKFNRSTFRKKIEAVRELRQQTMKSNTSDISNVKNNEVSLDITSDFTHLISALLPIQQKKLDRLIKLINSQDSVDTNTRNFLYEAVVDFDYSFYLAWESEQINLTIPPHFELQQSYIEEQLHILHMSLSMDAASEDIVEKLVKNEPINLDDHFYPDYHSPDEKSRRQYDAIISFGHHNTQGESPLEDNALLMLNRAILSEAHLSPESLKNMLKYTEDSKDMRRLISMCLRTLLWAKENDKEVPNQIKQFVKNATSLHIMPRMIEDRVMEEFLDIEASTTEKTYI